MRAWSCLTGIVPRAVYPARKLDAIVKRVMKREDFEGFGSNGDRAFVSVVRVAGAIVNHRAETKRETGSQMFAV